TRSCFTPACATPWRASTPAWGCASSGRSAPSWSTTSPSLRRRCCSTWTPPRITRASLRARRPRMPAKKDLPEIARLEVDRKLYIGSGLCVDIAPGVFQLDDEAVSTVVDPKAQPDSQILEAARGCPTMAIVLYDRSGGKIFPEEGNLRGRGQRKESAHRGSGRAAPSGRTPRPAPPSPPARPPPPPPPPRA